MRIVIPPPGPLPEVAFLGRRTLLVERREVALTQRVADVLQGLHVELLGPERLPWLPAKRVIGLGQGGNSQDRPLVKAALVLGATQYAPDGVPVPDIFKDRGALSLLGVF